MNSVLLLLSQTRATQIIHYYSQVFCFGRAQRMKNQKQATGSLGWIKFQLDVHLGTLIYMEHKYTDANSMVVGE